MNNELEEAITERETLKVQIQEYIAEVSRIEDLLAHKVRIIKGSNEQVNSVLQAMNTELEVGYIIKGALH